MTETLTRLGCGVLIGAVVVILALANRTPAPTSFFCDIQTINCYERLALPMEKFR